MITCSAAAAAYAARAPLSPRREVGSRRGGRSAGRLVGWSAGRLVGWSAGRLVGWSAGRLVGWSAGRLVGWSAGRACSCRRRGADAAAVGRGCQPERHPSSAAPLRHLDRQNDPSPSRSGRQRILLTIICLSLNASFPRLRSHFRRVRPTQTWGRQAGREPAQRRPQLPQAPVALSACRTDTTLGKANEGRRSPGNGTPSGWPAGHAKGPGRRGGRALLHTAGSAGGAGSAAGYSLPDL